MRLQRELSWPCRDCEVRSTSFCTSVIGPRPGAGRHISQNFFTAEKNETIYRDGDGQSPKPFVLCKGWAYRFHLFPDGRRQILSLLIPGDLYFPAASESAQPVHAIQAATDVEFCELQRDEIKRELAANTAARDEFCASYAHDIDESIAALSNLNESNPATRVANFLQRLVKRLAARGIRLGANVYPFPLAPVDIADAVGLTVDDVNRAIQILRTDRIADLSNGALTIINAAIFRSPPAETTRYVPVHNSAETENWVL